MKKLMATVLSLGLVLLDATPVMATGQTFAISPSIKPAETVLPVNDIEKIDNGMMKGVDIPEPPGFGMLSDEELEHVEGEGVAGVFIGAVAGFIGGAVGGAITAAVYTYASTGSVDWSAVGAGTLGGAVGTAIEGAIVGAVAGP